MRNSGLSATLKERAAEVAEGMVNKLQTDHERTKTKLVRAKARIATQGGNQSSERNQVEVGRLQSEIAHKKKLQAAMNEELERIKLERQAPSRVETVEDPTSSTASRAIGD